MPANTGRPTDRPFTPAGQMIMEALAAQDRSLISLAAAMGTNPTTLSKKLHGDRRLMPPEIMFIAAWLGIPARWLTDCEQGGQQAA